ncbi:MAG: hypothetical protein U9R15_05695 [Chloroflexota bacterium]|nr:hypothetical protein [Chloroflexota bacterium]
MDFKGAFTKGLLTPPGGLVIFEQTKIHPRHDIQARPIKFFEGLARAGRRVLVETHSSYMVDRLCLETVKDCSNWLVEHSSVLFVHPPDQDHDSARIELVEIDPNGWILNYPRGFLPDTAALKEEILKQSFAKRRELRNEKK